MAVHESVSNVKKRIIRSLLDLGFITPPLSTLPLLPVSPNKISRSPVKNGTVEPVVSEEEEGYELVDKSATMRLGSSDMTAATDSDNSDTVMVTAVPIDADEDDGGKWVVRYTGGSRSGVMVRILILILIQSPLLFVLLLY